MLWAQLRAKRFVRFKFRRQHPRGPFIVDFYCPSARLAVELDGGQHFEPQEQAYDDRRTDYLWGRGIRVLRFPTNLVFTELSSVLESIAHALGIDVPSP